MHAVGVCGRVCVLFEGDEGISAVERCVGFAGVCKRRVRARFVFVHLAVECGWGASVICGGVQCAGECHLRAGAICGRVRFAGECNLRASAICGRVRFTAVWDFRARPIYVRVGFAKEWNSRIRPIPNRLELVSVSDTHLSLPTTHYL